VVEPAFSEFRRACLATGVRVDEWRTTPAAHFRLDLDEVRNRLTTVGASAAYLCAPSSPSGVGVAAPAIATLCASMPEIAFIVDQSFLSLSERHRDATAPLPDNALVVRSLTKDHGIPGARVGYAFGRPRWVAAMSARRPPWTVNAFAQSAVAAAVEQTSFVERSRRRLLDDRRRLQRQLRALGLSPCKTSTPFFLMPVGDAAGLRERLLGRRGVHVRDATSFGLPTFIRVCARGESDCARLVAALRAEL
jgi:histidinol-phosphate/aromatic aminotransferase/cobyric acid decarboxylase-like protein